MGPQLYGYLREDHEYVTEVPELSAGDGELIICLSAHGGGTVGQAYAGNGWDYLVIAGGITVLEGSDLRSAEGRPAGHAEMARSLCSFLSAAGESLAYRGDRSDYAAEYGEHARQWLISQHERLALFAEG